MLRIYGFFVLFSLLSWLLIWAFSDTAKKETIIGVGKLLAVVAVVVLVILILISIGGGI